MPSGAASAGRFAEKGGHGGEGVPALGKGAAELAHELGDAAAAGAVRGGGGRRERGWRGGWPSASRKTRSQMSSAFEVAGLAGGVEAGEEGRPRGSRCGAGGEAATGLARGADEGLNGRRRPARAVGTMTPCARRSRGPVSAAGEAASNKVATLSRRSYRWGPRRGDQEGATFLKKRRGDTLWQVRLCAFAQSTRMNFEADAENCLSSVKRQCSGDSLAIRARRMESEEVFILWGLTGFGRFHHPATNR